MNMLMKKFFKINLYLLYLLTNHPIISFKIVQRQAYNFLNPEFLAFKIPKAFFQGLILLLNREYKYLVKQIQIAHRRCI